MNRNSNAALSARRSTLRQGAMVVGPDFYDRPTAGVARDLLGAVIECRVGRAVTRARIVEVEAYLGPHDPACHAAVGPTARNRHLHGPPGTAYVYRIYGMHWCVNAVTGPEGVGSAVLVRGVEPLTGIAIMRRRRGSAADRDLTNGPGKLCQAMGISGLLDGVPLHRGALRILAGEDVSDRDVVVTPRIGISRGVEWPLRFLVSGNAHVSRTPRDFARMTVAQARAWLRASNLR